MISYRVSWINGPDGRVVDSEVHTDREAAEAAVRRNVAFISTDELLVFEVVENAEWVRAVE